MQATKAGAHATMPKFIKVTDPESGAVTLVRTSEISAVRVGSDYSHVKSGLCVYNARMDDAKAIMSMLEDCAFGKQEGDQW